MDTLGQVGIRVQSGIPVIELQGAWLRASADRICETIRALGSAGHLEIVLNVQRAVVQSSAGLDALWSAARWIRSKHGQLEIVATVEQADRLFRAVDVGLARISTSEERAISRIKGTPIRVHGPSFTARMGAERQV
jgi:anti-anti-sigma regulatory factor